MTEPLGEMPDFQVLKIKADGPTGFDLTEISLGGKPLLDVVSISLEVNGGITRATLVVEVIPDVEVVADVTSRPSIFPTLPPVRDDGLAHHGESFPGGAWSCSPDCPSCSAFFTGEPVRP